MSNIKTFEDSIKYLDSINDLDNNYYLDSKWHSYDNLEWYKKILEKVLEDKPARVVDIGSNLNQYGYLFANEDIEYIGVDIDTTIPNPFGFMQPIITDKIKYIQANYRDIKEYFKDDVIISCLCVGYLIGIQEVLCKRLIINDLDGGKPIAREVINNN